MKKNFLIFTLVIGLIITNSMMSLAHTRTTYIVEGSELNDTKEDAEEAIYLFPTNPVSIVTDLDSLETNPTYLMGNVSNEDLEDWWSIDYFFPKAVSYPRVTIKFSGEDHYQVSYGNEAGIYDRILKQDNDVIVNVNPQYGPHWVHIEAILGGPEVLPADYNIEIKGYKAF